VPPYFKALLDALPLRLFAGSDGVLDEAVHEQAHRPEREREQDEQVTQ
jgi:hypothetical protein